MLVAPPTTAAKERCPPRVTVPPPSVWHGTFGSGPLSASFSSNLFDAPLAPLACSLPLALSAKPPAMSPPTCAAVARLVAASHVMHAPIRRGLLEGKSAGLASEGSHLMQLITAPPRQRAAHCRQILPIAGRDDRPFSRARQAASESVRKQHGVHVAERCATHVSTHAPALCLPRLRCVQLAPRLHLTSPANHQ